MLLNKSIWLLAGLARNIVGRDSAEDSADVRYSTSPRLSVRRFWAFRRGLKVYFADVGLATFLLGIHTPEQLARDPLRGNLYENLVIADVLKARYNTGQRPELFFYRDSQGNEVDLLIRDAGFITPVEIKSASTFTPHFIQGLERFHALGAGRCAPGVVLYNGEQRFTVHGVRVFNPLAVANPTDEILKP